MTPSVCLKRKLRSFSAYHHLRCKNLSSMRLIVLASFHLSPQRQVVMTHRSPFTLRTPVIHMRLALTSGMSCWSGSVTPADVPSSSSDL